MPDLSHAHRVAHLDPAFQEDFRSWAELRGYLADRASHGFPPERAIHQLLSADLAHRLAATADHGWFLRGSLALPARPQPDLPLPERVRNYGQGSGIDPRYVMARRPMDLDLCAVDRPEGEPVTSEQLVETLRQVVDTRPEPGTDQGTGLGGLVHYWSAPAPDPDRLRVIARDGRAVAKVRAQPIDPRAGPDPLPVDDPVYLQVDLSPPGAATFTGPPEPAHRSTLAVDVPGFQPYRPDMYPTDYQVADKLCTVSVPREPTEPPPAHHRFKDLADLYYLTSTCRIDAGRLRQAVAGNPTLATFEHTELPAPFRLYGHRPGPDEVEVPWREGYERLRAGRPELRDYPDFDEVWGSVAEFVDGWSVGDDDRIWLPVPGWVSPETAQLIADTGRIRRETSRLADRGSAASDAEALAEQHRRDYEQFLAGADERPTGREGPGLRR